MSEQPIPRKPRAGDLTFEDVTVPVQPEFQSCPEHRDSQVLCCVVDQFDVARNGRYRVRDTSGDGKADTFCNVFVADVTRALGAELPHWWRGRELSANGLCDWLKEFGEGYGWLEATPGEAVGAANRGQPVVVVWRNPAGSGHVAVVLPSAAGELRIAQAGAANFFDRPLAAGFGSRQVTFYSHR